MCDMQVEHEHKSQCSEGLRLKRNEKWMIIIQETRHNALKLYEKYYCWQMNGCVHELKQTCVLLLSLFFIVGRTFLRCFFILFFFRSSTMYFVILFKGSGEREDFTFSRRPCTMGAYCSVCNLFRFQGRPRDIKQQHTYLYNALDGNYAGMACLAMSAITQKIFVLNYNGRSCAMCIVASE